MFTSFRARTLYFSVLSIFLTAFITSSLFCASSFKDDEAIEGSIFLSESLENEMGVLTYSITNVVCLDQSTTNPADDLFQFDLTVSGGPVGSNFKATSSLFSIFTLIGDYDVPYTVYVTDPIVTLGTITFPIEDLNDPSCSIQASVDPPATCSPVCTLNVDYTVDECTSSGRNVSYVITGMDGMDWMVKLKNETTGAETTVDSGSNNGSGSTIIPNDGNQYTIWTFKSGYFDCLIDLGIPVCDPNICDYDIMWTIETVSCNDLGTTDPSDDLFSFTILVTGGPPGGNWQASNPLFTNVTESGTYGIAKTIFINQPIVNVGTINFTIQDLTDPDCMVPASVNPPVPCSPICTINVDFTVGNCTVAGRLVEYTITGMDGMEWMVKLKNENTGAETSVDSGFGNGSSSTIVPNDGNQYTVWVFKSGYFDCLVDIGIPVCDCTDSPNVTAITTDATCGLSNGSLEISWSGGVGPYSLSGSGLNANPATSPQVFTNLSSGIYVVTVTDANACTGVASGMIDNLDGPQVDAFPTDATCGLNNGEVEISWFGGTGPFTISGDLNQSNATNPQSFTGLSAGSYSIIITDSNNCTDLVNFVIGTGDGPTLNAIPTDATCFQNNGEIMVSWFGGTGPFTISGDLSQANATNPFTFTGLSTGSYALTITDANGCMDVTNVIIGNLNGPQIEAFPTDASCGLNNGEVLLSWTDGTGPFTISGDLNQANTSSPQNFTGLSAGTYFVLVTDSNNCTDQVNFTIGNSNGPLINAIPTDATCFQNNGEILVEWFGGTGPFTISGDLNQTNASNPQVFNGLASGTYMLTITDINGCMDFTSVTVGNLDGPQADAFPNDATCGLNNGDVVIAWSNGTGPFSISGDLNDPNVSSPHSFLGLAEGIYFLTVTDATNCTDEVSFVIANTDGPLVNANSTDASCGLNNGEVEISWTSGTGPFTISGDLSQSNASSPHTFTGLSAGTYAVLVTDANGCTATASTTVGTSSAISILANPTDASCGLNNGEVEITWTGGTAPYNISGDLSQTNATSPHTFTGLSAGTYNVLVTDANGCTATASTTIGSSSGLLSTASSIDATCGLDNGEVEISWTGGTGPFVIMGDLSQTNASSPQTFTGLSAGTYTVTITDSNGCSDTASATVSASSGLSSNAIPTDASCGLNNGEIEVSWVGGTGPYTISGDLNQANATNPQTFTGLSGGTYMIVITDSNGCSDMASVTVGSSSGLFSLTDPIATTCGLNNGEVEVSWMGGTGPFTISGDLSQGNATSPETFTGLSAGSYTITVTDANGCSDTASAVVGGSSELISTADVIDATCGLINGEVELSWAGGTGPYTISGDLSQANATSPQTFTGLSAGSYTATITDVNGCSDIVSATVGSSAGLGSNANALDASCGLTNGEVEISWTGGTGPYNISGDLTQANATSPQTFTGLSAGTYTVTVTDVNGCSDTASATVGSSTGLLSSGLGTATTCGLNNGEVEISWTGGTGPYNISGDLTQANATSPQTFTGLSAGTYTVTVTDVNGCSDTASATVGSSTGLLSSGIGTDASCGLNNGEVEISWTGGTGPYNISGDLTQANATSPQTFTGLSAGTYTVTVTDVNGCSDTASATVGSSTGLLSSGIGTATTCGLNNGEVEISWTGGTGPYNISGDLTQANATSPQTFTGLSAGTYNVTVTDVNGCSDTASATVGSSTGLLSSGIGTDASCGLNNGEVEISWTGGTGPFTISGDLSQANATSPQTFTGLSAGTYNVMVTDVNGCSDNASITIGSSSGLSANATTTSTSCGANDGSVTLNWTGGTGPFTISGDLSQSNATSPQSFNNLSSGSYSLTITDINGCSDTVVAVVTNLNGPTASSVATPSLCGNDNGSITVSWNGGFAPFNISGDLNQTNATSPFVFSNLAPGNYNITVSDASGCTSVASATVEDQASPNTNATGVDASCGLTNGEVEITWTGGTGPFTISGDLSQANATSPQTFTGLGAGTYTVTVTDANGCSNTASTIIGSSSGLSSNATGVDASCGLTNGEVEITWTGGTGPFTVSGDLSQANATSPQTFTGLGAGTYTVTVTDANGCSDTASTSIGSSSGLSSNATGVDASCGLTNGEVEITWTGGTGPFTISGDLSQANATSPQTFTGLGAGTYTVTVTDANGCSNTASTIIGSSSGLSSNATGVDASCGLTNGEVEITWTGGTGPFTISGDLSQANATSPQTFTGLSAGTYTITVTDANGCSDTASTTIGSSSGLSPNATGVDASCGLTNGEVEITWSGGTGPYNISGDLSQANATSPQTFTGLSAGTYTITVTDANGCSDTASTTIGSSSGLLSIGNGTDTSCGLANGEVEITWTGGTGPFTISGDLSQANATSPQTFTGLNAGTYAVTVTDANGCSNTASANVGSSIGLMPNAISTDASCGLTNGEIQVTWSGGTGPFNISGDLSQTNAVSPQTFTGLSAGTYMITVTDVNGCSGTATSIVLNSERPMANTQAVNTTCGFSNGSVTIEWMGGVAPFTISGDLFQVNAVSPQSFTGLSAGTYSVVVTDSNGCTDTATAMVGTSMGLVSSANSSDATCGQDNGEIQVIWSAGTAPFSISGDLSQSNATSPQNFTGLSVGSYTVTVTDVNGCTDTATANIGNVDGPAMNTSVVNTSCGNSDGSITITWTNGTGPFIISGDLFQLNATSPHTFTGLSAGNYSLELTDNNGCSDSVLVTVGDSDQPVANASAVNTTCGNSDGSVTITWTEGTGPFVISGDLFSANATSPQTFTGLSAGSYSVIVTDSNGCSDTATATIASSNQPIANGSAMNTTCGNSDGSVTITWTDGTGPFTISGDLSQMNAVSPQTFTGLSAGTYNITVTDNNGCTDTAFATVGGSNQPLANASAVNTNCGNSDGSVTITWTQGTGPFTISGDLSQMNAVSPQVFTGLGAGTYTVTVTDSNGCTNTASATVGGSNQPVANASAMNTTCGDSNGSVTISWIDGTGPFVISGDLFEVNATSPHTFTDLGVGSYSVIVTDSNGCTGAASVTVGDSNRPMASSTSVNATCGLINGQVVISWSGGTGPFTLSGDLSQTNASNPQTFTGLNPGSYTVTVTDINGCTDTVTALVGNSEGPFALASTINSTCEDANGSVTIDWFGGTAPFAISGDLFQMNAISPQEFNGLIAGDYTITLTDANGCVSVRSFEIENEEQVSALCTVLNHPSCLGNDGEVTASGVGGPLPYTYLWSDGSTDATNSDLIPGTYLVTVTDANGCGSICSVDLDFPNNCLTHRKELVSILQETDGTSTVVYEIIVENTGVFIEDYTLTDTPFFENDIVIESASFTSTAVGHPANPTPVILSGSGPWTLASIQNIAGLSSDSYFLTVNVSIDLLDPNSVGDEFYEPCGNGNPDLATPYQGLFNQSALDIDHDGTPEEIDEVCGDIIIFDLALRKTLQTTGPYNYDDLITFEIEVFNQGNVDAFQVQITDYIPSGFMFVSNVNPGWMLTTNGAVYTIPTIEVGMSRTIPITLKLMRSIGSMSWDNYAEISQAMNPNGEIANDIDSTPDQDQFNDNLVKPGDPDDNEIFGNGPTLNEDEDDSDPAAPKIFDLALIKTINMELPSYELGDFIQFDIKLVNQGNETARDINVIDYIPCGFGFASGFNGAWFYNPLTNQANYTYSGLLNPGEEVVIPLILEVQSCSDDINAWTNYAEITATKDIDGFDNSGDDIDSTPDDIIDNDAGGEPNTVNDDNLDGDGVDDEDDHDPAIIPIYDLAQIITLADQSPYQYGDDITFNVKVCNQGNRPVEKIEITGYMPVGYTFNPVLNDMGWTIWPDGDIRYFYPDVINPGDCVDIPLVLTINQTQGGDKDWIIYTQITGFTNELLQNVLDIDSTPGTSNSEETNLLPGDLADNDLTSTDKGGEEDDHDPAGIQINDLALRKVVTSDGPYVYGDVVDYTIEVYNQGSTVMNDVVVVEYVPNGLSFDPSLAGNEIWQGSTPFDMLTSTLSGSILPGEIRLLTLKLIAGPSDDLNAWTNSAEIKTAKDENGQVIEGDIDSNFDMDPNNDNMLECGDENDDEINEDGLNIPGDDEDDQDIACIEIFDLALIKEVVSQQPYQYGELIEFKIVVRNQGNVDAVNVQVVDYMPIGYSFLASNNLNWIDMGNGMLRYDIPVSIVAGGQDIEIPLFLTLEQTSGGVNNYNNFAEIKQSESTEGTTLDADSNADMDPTNDPETECGDPLEDNSFDGEGLEAGDEDDTDPACIEIYDLALRKVVITNGPYVYGDVIEYSIEVHNQGNKAVNDVVVVEYVPNGLVYDPSLVGNDIWEGIAPYSMLTSTISGSILPGEIRYLTIRLIAQSSDELNGWTNSAEIKTAKDENGQVIDGDIDSNFDMDPTNDNMLECGDENDDEINEDGLNNPGDDEDDQDIACIEIYDVALIKWIDDKGPYMINEIADYNIRVFNQGNVPVYNVEVTDYIRDGYAFDSTINPGWFMSQGLLKNVIQGPIAPGASILLSLKLQVVVPQNATMGSWYNEAEVSNITNEIGEDQTDFDSILDDDPDNDNDLVDGPDPDLIFDEEDNNDNVIDENIFNPEDDDEDDNDAAEIIVVGGLGDTVFKDLDGDGIQDPNEPGVEGVIVTLTDCNGNVLETQITDSEGFYFFNNLIPGNYQVGYDLVNLPVGCAFTYANQGTDDALDSDVDVLTGLAPCTYIDGGEYDSTFDAGLLILASIGDMVWHDIDGDGQMDLNEPGIAGVVVHLYNDSWELIRTTATDPNGKYLFDLLYPGNYYLQFETPEGMEITFPNTGVNDGTDSDVDGSNGPGTTTITHLDPGENDLDWDAGYYFCVPIGELVWYDEDEDDVWDEIENGINGLEVNLWKNHFGTWTIWETTVTSYKPGSPSDDGYFKFCAPPGQYYIEVLMPIYGLVPVQPDRGNIEAHDSDIDNTYGFGTSDDFVVFSGQEKCDLGAGYYPMAQIGDRVWRDDNGNGQQDVGEPAMSGVLVEAFNAIGEKIAEATTSVSGTYNIDYLQRDDYFLRFTPPTGYGMTTANLGNDQTDSDVDHSNGPNTTKFYQMNVGDSIPHVDAGLVFGVVPVEWLSFTGENRGSFNQLLWSTASEFNSSHFEVYKRHQSDSDFRLIGKVASKGSTSEITNYDLKDFDLEKSGIYYYRLKQVDLDGGFDFSQTISIKVNAIDNAHAVSVYPNPAIDHINLDLNINQLSDVQISIWDANGKVVKRNFFMERLQPGEHTRTINIQDLNAGVYQLNFKIGLESFNQKLIVLKK